MSQITQLLKQHRRNLHAYPETAWTEFQTTWYIYQQLMGLPFKLRLGKEILNEAFVLNRNEEEVKISAKRALDNGVPKEFIHILDEFTGVLATFETHKSGPTFVLRFDIDALPIQETETLSICRICWVFVRGMIIVCMPADTIFIRQSV